MKKLCAGLLIVLFLGLCACGGRTEPPEEAATTTDAITAAVTMEEPVTPDPNRPLAIMEPVQGGPMLYTFTGKNGKLGLINQDGELVAQPQYEQSNHWNYSATFSLRVEYTRDANGRIDGITLQKGEKGEEIIHYTLDGESRPVKGFPDVGGRYAILDEGLYDVANDRWKLAPKEGQKITDRYKDRVFLQQTEANGTTKLYVYVLEDERIQELPEGVHAYLAETGLYRAGGIFQDGEYYYEYYDQDLKLLPEGEYDRLLAQINRTHESPYDHISVYYGQCWVGRDANAKEGTGTVLDPDLNPLYTTRPGEEVIKLHSVPRYESQVMGLVVQDAKGNIVKSFDEYGKPMQSKPEAQLFSDGIYTGTLYKLKDGKWTTLDLRQFMKPDIEAHNADSMIVTEDWVIVVTGQAYESTEIDEIFAVDWTGKQYNNCPLMPFIPGHYLQSAGEQGPNYYWVEHDGKRGYVNTKGEWLFVEQ